jgi:trehalose 6-phosphate phosphatase
MALLQNSVLSAYPLGLVFDIDGTLCPISSAPDTAQLWPGVAEDLMRASHHAHIATLTGRGAQDGARIVNVEGLTYSSIHGLEWSSGLPTAETVHLLPEAEIYAEPGKQLFDLLEQYQEELPGVILLRKSVGGSVIYQPSSAPEQARAQILALLEEPARDRGMRLDENTGLIEILAPLPINKGEALRRYVHQHKLQGVIFAGDDRLDLDAILEIKRLRQEGIAALSIVVQHTYTLPAMLEHGDIIVNDVEGMAEQLRAIVLQLEHSFCAKEK